MKTIALGALAIALLTAMSLGSSSAPGSAPAARTLSFDDYLAEWCGPGSGDLLATWQEFVDRGRERIRQGREERPDAGPLLNYHIARIWTYQIYVTEAAQHPPGDVLTPYVLAVAGTQGDALMADAIAALDSYSRERMSDAGCYGF